MKPRLAGLAALVVLAAGLRLVVGDPAGWHLPENALVWELRLWRLIPGATVGAALALAGVLLQTLLRNSLASPDLIGASSGAGLGIILALYVSHLAGRSVSDASVPVGSLAAVAGSMAALSLVYALGRRSRALDPVTLVLVGAMVSIVASSASVLIAYLLPGQGASVARWTIGTISDDTPRALAIGVGVLTLAAGAWSIARAGSLDAAGFSDDESRSVGVDLAALRRWCFIASGLLTAGSVALAGPIGFVGLVCPHLARSILGPGHRPVVIGSILLGVAMIVGADAAVDLVRPPSGRLPIGVATSLVGGPIFIALLVRARRD